MRTLIFSHLAQQWTCMTLSHLADDRAAPTMGGPMSSSPATDQQGLRILFGLACAVVVIAGLKLGAPLLVPLFVAAFLSVLCIPPMRRLQRHHVPTGVAIAIVVTAVTIVVFLVTAVIGNSLFEFQDELPEYRDRLREVSLEIVFWLQDIGLDVSAGDFIESFDASALFDLVSNAALGLFAALSNLFVVVLIMVFILIEANDFPRKMRRAVGDPNADLSEYARAAEQTYRYLAIKTAVSGVTGVLVALWVFVCDVDLPLLWGLIAFLFNFVPNIGSIIAAVPAVLLAALQHGLVTALLVASGYLVFNMAIGNVIEPRLMGRRLGLSPLVVVLSLVFWGWAWGPVGMLLSVPLTMIIKILLEHSDQFRPIAILLGGAGEENHRTPGTSASVPDDD